MIPVASWLLYLRVFGALVVVTVFIAAVIDLVISWWRRCH